MIDCDNANVFMGSLQRIAESRCIPLNVTFELTPHCNFDCVMCYVRLTKEQAAEIILSCDLSNLEKFNSVVREDVEGILKVAEPEEPVAVEAPKTNKVKETIEVVLNDEV